MIKTMLVAAAGNDGDAATLTAALTVARSLAAHLDVLHVKLDPVATGVAMTADTGAGALSAGLIQRLEQDAAEREAAARADFARLAAGQSAEWHVETGDERRWMTTYGVAADLIVASRGSGANAAARSTLEAVLLESGRPILVPAAVAMTADFARIAIAWKPTAQAARAVAAALPFLQKAREVRLVGVAEAGGEETHDSARLARSLARHGITVATETIAAGPDGAAAALLVELAGRTDLLVMGGYGHSRLREWVFGGFTQHMLDDAPLPILMAH